jgi:hypothetical protein
MDYSFQQDGKLKALNKLSETMEQGPLGKEEGFNQGAVSPPGQQGIPSYEDAWSPPRSTGSKVLSAVGSFLTPVVYGLAGGMANRDQPGGFSAGMAQGSIQGLQQYTKNASEEERLKSYLDRAYDKSESKRYAYSQATDMMRNWGTTHPGEPMPDFNTVLQEAYTDVNNDLMEQKMYGNGKFGILARERGLDTAMAETGKKGGGGSGGGSSGGVGGKPVSAAMRENARKVYQAKIKSLDSLSGLSGKDKAEKRAEIESEYVATQKKWGDDVSEAPGADSYYGTGAKVMDFVSSMNPFGAKPQAQSSASAVIRVRDKKSGKTGSVPASEYDPKLYDKI